MKPPSFTPEQLFEHCRPAGVERIVLIQMSFYRFDNSYMLDTLERFPGVFSAVGIVDEAASGVGQRMKDLAERGVRGFRVHPGKDVDAWIDSPGMAEMWSTAADANLAICPLINPSALPAIARMCQRYPQTKVVIDHFARIGMASPTGGEDLDRLCKLARFAKVHVKTSAFYALGEKKPPYLDLAPMIRRLRDAFGAERLMWASDSPFQVQNDNTYADSIALVRDHLDFISDVERAWLLKKTAEKVFFAS
jgi:predicted TIM-barrel fold metal-dependent hydrolase